VDGGALPSKEVIRAIKVLAASFHTLAHATHIATKLLCLIFSFLVIFFQNGSSKPYYFRSIKLCFILQSRALNTSYCFLNIARSPYIGNKKNITLNIKTINMKGSN